MAKQVTKPTPKGAAEKAGATVGSLIVLSKNALSTDVGPAVISTLFKSGERSQELTSEMNALKTKSRAELSRLTLAIVKLAENDRNVNLADVYSGDAKLSGRVNSQIGIALGFKVEKPLPADKATGTASVAIVYNPALSYAFPMPGESEKNSPTFRQRNTFRTNFLTQLKKCAGAAHEIVERKMSASFDPKAGTLMISGPAVKKAFGQDRVALDERQNFVVGTNKVELSQKPSFQALANMGAATAGAAVVSGDGNQHRGARAGTVGGTAALESAQAATATGKLPMDKAVISVCKSITELLGKVTKLSKEATAALEALQNTLEVKLANG